MTNAFNILVGKHEGKRPLGRPRYRWEDNVKMDLKEVGLKDVDWIHVVQDGNLWWAVTNMAMNRRVP
jgi:hypothetical protein